MAAPAGPALTPTESRCRIEAEALKLIRCGARAGLVQQLTGLSPARIGRMYREVHHRHSPPGLAPYTDTWLMKSLMRRLHASIVWRYHHALADHALAPAAHLIALDTLYHQAVREPLLDIARIHSIPVLVQSGIWQVQHCVECGVRSVGPAGEPQGLCPACLLYRRHRCPTCGRPLPGHLTGRMPSRCHDCGKATVQNGPARQRRAGPARRRP
ncbi:MAG: FlhC family transcriptional regulator [Gammaproteobacteria bacterium]|nr:FlhC family transcriptional regulator [Gammaproteobacteria bacterium]